MRYYYVMVSHFNGLTHTYAICTCREDAERTLDKARTRYTAFEGYTCWIKRDF